MSDLFINNEFISLKDDDWLQKQRIAGKCVGNILAKSKHLIESATPNLNLLDIENFAIECIESFDCTATFKDYKGFPGSICASVNNELVHGIPRDYVLQKGDVVKIDLGATYDGVIADAAITAIYGEPIKKDHVYMLELCKKSLDKAIDSIAVGKQLGIIGQTIYRTVRGYPYHLITNYGGHGLELNTPHAHPFVYNKAKAKEGIRIQKGLTIAIEPMLSLKSDKTKVLDDGWTIVTKDISCHFEHTIFVHDTYTEIMTKWEDIAYD